tara:strand:+ start:473 stop:973 length:501 start_codon:yes stop_codon:yes gene_type:complete
MITLGRLKELLDYNECTGVFTWKISPAGNTKKNSIAGCDNGHGYIRIRIDGGRFRAHRLAWLYITGCHPTEQIDHINGNRSDNRIKNLREVSQLNNNRNRGINSNNTSGFTGVTFDKSTGKWIAQIEVKGFNHLIGRFINKSDAVKARVEKEIELGFHINHGSTRT